MTRPERRKLWQPSRFTTTTQTHSAPNCRCGHYMPDHLDGTGPCQEPSHTCGCLAYTEVCPVCGHTRDDGGLYHTGLNGQCTQIIQATGIACGCAYYIVPAQDPPARNTALAGS
jgi:hypothetical protein